LCDARGHGDTPVGKEMNLDWWMHGTEGKVESLSDISATDLLITINEAKRRTKESGKGPERFIGIGHSMGGAVLLLAQILGSLFYSLFALMIV
jgi:alpha-beta hydrolase superfamily lysophospholipase